MHRFNLDRRGAATEDMKSGYGNLAEASSRMRMTWGNCHGMGKRSMRRKRRDVTQHIIGVIESTMPPGTALSLGDRSILGETADALRAMNSSKASGSRGLPPECLGLASVGESSEIPYRFDSAIVPVGTSGQIPHK